jgi:hypothetical protein
VGEVINLQLIASDADGNTSATADGQTQSTAFTPVDGNSNIACQPTDNGYPASCIQALPGSPGATPQQEGASTPDSATGAGTEATTGPAEYDPGPPVTLTPVFLGAVTSGLSLLNPFRISVINDGWSTIRNAAQSYVIGNAHNGWLMNIATTVNTSGSKSGNEVYALGAIGGDYQNRCGWVQAANFGFGVGPVIINPCPDNFGPTPKDFAIGLNCENCTDGTAVRTIADTQRFANVYPNPYPTPPEAGPRNGIDPIDTLKAGFLVRWRYVTTDDRWVMVRVGSRTDGFPNWVFIARGALPQHLCTRTSCTPQS